MTHLLLSCTAAQWATTWSQLKSHFTKECFANISRQVLLTPPVCSLCAASFWIIKLRLVRQRPLVPPRVNFFGLYIYLFIYTYLDTRTRPEGHKMRKQRPEINFKFWHLFFFQNSLHTTAFRYTQSWVAAINRNCAACKK